MKKLLIVCGPTATGKTHLALMLAAQFSGELMSADSRHIYKGLDILSGKDIPDEFVFKGGEMVVDNVPLRYYGNGTRIWLVDVLPRNVVMSASLYKRIGMSVLGDIWSRGCLPIIAGGTGFYIRALVDGFETLHLPPNPVLRRELATLPTHELQEKLVSLDPRRHTSMNPSDWNNPRRLIRAIEVAQNTPEASAEGLEGVECLWIGLRAPIGVIEQHIRNRIEERMQKGVFDEVKEFKERERNYKDAVPTIGMGVIVLFLEGKITREEALAGWFRQERQYAKRQFTWFSKEKRITWFDVSSDTWESNVTSYVSRWYTRK